MISPHPWTVPCMAMSQAFSVADEASLGAIAITSAARPFEIRLFRTTECRSTDHKAQEMLACSLPGLFYPLIAPPRLQAQIAGTS